MERLNRVQILHKEIEREISELDKEIYDLKYNINLALDILEKTIRIGINNSYIESKIEEAIKCLK